MLADKANLDFNKIRKITKDGYPRAESLPSAGFAAGPCLLKDTMQLLSFSRNNFSIGNSSMLVNEGLVLYLIDKLETKYNLKSKNVGLLGMAFKAECDDTRSSLSYKMKKILSAKVNKIYCTDPFVKTDKNLSSLEKIPANGLRVVLMDLDRIFNPLGFGGSLEDYLGATPAGNYLVQMRDRKSVV